TIDVKTYTTPNGTLFSVMWLNRPLNILQPDYCNLDIKELMSSSFIRWDSIGRSLSAWRWGEHVPLHITLLQPGAKRTAYTFSTHRATFTVCSDRPPLSYEFSRDLYRRIIETYGTHYIRQVYLGGRFRRVTAARTCLSRLNGLSSSTVYVAHMSSETSKHTLYQKTTSKIPSCHLGAQLLVTGYQCRPGKDQNCLLIKSTAAKSYRTRASPLVQLWTPPALHREQYLKDHGIKSSTTQPYCGWHDPNLDSSCCPKQASKGRLVVTIVRAWGLKGDRWGRTEGYVYGSIYRKTRMIRSNSPRWNARYDLGKVSVDTHLGLKVEVWDEDWGRDDRLGSCTRTLRQGTHRFTCPAKRGGFEILYTLTCDRHLTGDRCHQYKPSP
uniref:C2 domain-containing protein n=1 Tax=Seriola dumerili TaxID=41447 RepID=A0A3B4USH3_SERDU